MRLTTEIRQKSHFIPLKGRDEFLSYRFMRVIVFFDLPVITPENRRDYNRFRRFLVKNGFIMLQESVYCRMVLNQTVASTVLNNLKINRPPQGLVQVLNVTEKQFERMEFITGSFKSDVIDSDERLVIL